MMNAMRVQSCWFCRRILLLCLIAAGRGALVTGGGSHDHGDNAADDAARRLLEGFRLPTALEAVPSCPVQETGCGGEAHVSIRYPQSLNRLVMGLTDGGWEAISGAGQRAYRVEVQAGAVSVAGELQWWVEVDPAVVADITFQPSGGEKIHAGGAQGARTGLVSQWVEIAACSSQIYTQNVWLVSTMEGVPFRAHAAFTWRWGGLTQDVATQVPGVPLKVNAASAWGHSALPPAPKEDRPPLPPAFPCPEGLTLVTAAVDLTSSWQAPQRTWEAYGAGVRRLLALHCPILVFVDQERMPALEEYVHELAQLVPLNMERLHAEAADAFGPDFASQVRHLRDARWKTRKWNWSKIAESEAYLTLILLKPILFARAALLLPPPSKGGGVHVWVDSVKDCLALLQPPLTVEVLEQRVRDGRVFVTAYAGLGSICKGSESDVDGLPCALLPNFSVKASFFAAQRSSVGWLAARYIDKVVAALSQGYLLTEEYYLAMLVRSHRPRFSVLHLLCVCVFVCVCVFGVSAGV